MASKNKKQKKTSLLITLSIITIVVVVYMVVNSLTERDTMDVPEPAEPEVREFRTESDCVNLPGYAIKELSGAAYPQQSIITVNIATCDGTFGTPDTIYQVYLSPDTNQPDNYQFHITSNHENNAKQIFAAKYKMDQFTEMDMSEIQFELKDTISLVIPYDYIENIQKISSIWVKVLDRNKEVQQVHYDDLWLWA